MICTCTQTAYKCMTYVIQQQNTRGMGARIDVNTVGSYPAPLCATGSGCARRPLNAHKCATTYNRNRAHPHPHHLSMRHSAHPISNHDAVMVGVQTMSATTVCRTLITPTPTHLQCMYPAVCGQQTCHVQPLTFPCVAVAMHLQTCQVPPASRAVTNNFRHHMLSKP